MTIKIGNQYVHTVLGHVNDDGITMITEDTELATMAGKYVGISAEESTDPASYAWTEISSDEETDEDLDTEEDEEDVDDTSSLLYRLANTQMTESIQGNLIAGTNQGADGWTADAGTIAAVECQPDDNGTTANGVEWAAPAGGHLSRAESIPGEAVPETVTVSFWWRASAACGLTASIGDNETGVQSNYDTADVDADGNTLDLSGSWLYFRAALNITATADAYAVKLTANAAAVIDFCNFKAERGDKATAWTASVDEALTHAQEAATLARNAGINAEAAQNTADAAQLTIDGLTLVKDGTVYIDNGKLYVDDAFVNGLFARDITATGTISGLKLRGQQIDIEAKGYESKTFIRTTEEDDEYILDIGNEYGEETALIWITPRLIGISAPVISTCCTDHFESNYIKNTYTSFDGNVVSGGSVTVVKKLGWCLIHGSIKPNDYIGDWAEVLPPSAAPAPQHGSGVYTTAHYWRSSYTRPLRIGIGAGGSLRIEYGSANSYTFAITYPIE